MNQSWQNNSYSISTDQSKLDLKRIHKNLTTSYWAEGIPLSIVEKAVLNSLCFGLYSGAEQVGLARVVSDYATFAYICDVYIEKEFQKKGLGKWLMKCVMESDRLQGLRRYCLGTRDAHGLYRQVGFEVIPKPENWMEIRHHDLYKKS